MLDDLTTEDFQTLYTHEMNVQGVSANTVIHYHANICRALQYAVKIKLIVANLPDLVESPKKNNYVVSFYNAEELNQLLAVIRGERIEIEKDRTKNKASRRILPLVDTFYELLIRMKK
ncbi:hypothetical protein [Paenibacillus sp. FSL M7-0134]|uniref:hypothetical protein n=1 Tax=Paenibacillus sp. FSL M7-0134 TaxID=2954754 RepID=UPI0030FC0E84